ncbi:class I SAM-dependent methyltransferase [Candidatus Leptofilum sp.]|uniref:class I SAM-dependent methyltransferase n=1 Tax=Candidatus Leptofilum sp. TaxID=3241576 RepID=UPI003B5C4470
MVKKLFRKLRSRFRQKRYAVIIDQMQLEKVSGFVLDLGGGPASFFAEKYPKQEEVILVEIKPDAAYRAKAKIPDINVIIADAENLPLANKSVALTVCNSVIEHVADPDALAAETQRVSKNFFLQTPNGHFPLETHSYIAIPFFNWLPGPTAKKAACALFGANFEYVQSVRYLSEARLRKLFPNATIAYERFLLMKKSFYLYEKSGKVQ